jgi:hypothetical protein
MHEQTGDFSAFLRLAVIGQCFHHHGNGVPTLGTVLFRLYLLMFIENRKLQHAAMQ